MEFSNEVNLEVKPIITYKEHTSGVEKIRFNPSNQNEFMSASHDASIRLWDINSHHSVKKISGIE